MKPITLDGCAVFLRWGFRVGGYESGGCTRRFRPLVQSFLGSPRRKRRVRRGGLLRRLAGPRKRSAKPKAASVRHPKGYAPVFTVRVTVRAKKHSVEFLKLLHHTFSISEAGNTAA